MKESYKLDEINREVEIRNCSGSITVSYKTVLKSASEISHRLPGTILADILGEK